MAKDEALYRIYVKEICSNCKNSKTCQEELRIRVDGSIWCTEYERRNKNEKKVDKANRRGI